MRSQLYHQLMGCDCRVGAGTGTAEASTTAAEPRQRPDQYIDLRKTCRTTEVSPCPSWPLRVMQQLQCILFMLSDHLWFPLKSTTFPIQVPDTITCHEILSCDFSEFFGRFDTSRSMIPFLVPEFREFLKTPTNP